VLEVVLLTLVTGAVAIFLPSAFDCEHPTRQLLMKDSIGCLSQEDAHQISHGTVEHEHLSQLLYTGNHSTLEQLRILEMLGKYRVDPEQRQDDSDGYGDGRHWKDTVWLDNAAEQRHVHLHYQHSYTCDPKDYNPMSMLWLNGGVKGVKVLMQRGFPHMLDAGVLTAFCVVYFLLAAYTSGVSVPAGLIVPHLLIGGSYGRAFGLIGIAEKKEWCSALHDLEAAAPLDTLHFSTVNMTDPGAAHRSLGESEPGDWMFDNTMFWSTVYRWVGRDCRLPDPGMYAVVGMSAFLSGSGRITMMLATVMVELTDDAAMIAPVGMAAIVSMIVGNMFNHGLYHGLIPVMNLPFLNADPSDVMNLVSVADTMARDLRCVSKSSKPDDVKKLLDECAAGEVTHHAFPVVDDHKTHTGKKLRGIISLDALKVAAMGGVGHGRRAVLLRRQRMGVTTSAAATEWDDREMTEKETQDAVLWLHEVPLLQDIEHDLHEKIARAMQVRGS
jgi:CBS domain-containing protein